MYLKRGDWLLCVSDDNQVDDLAIFALVLDTRESFTKIARWQVFGRFRLSDIIIPTVFVKRYYTKIGSLNRLDSRTFDNIKNLLSKVPETSMFDRSKEVYAYDKAIYKESGEGHGTIEAIFKYRRRGNKRETLEEDILRCIEESNPPTEECREFLRGLQKNIEKLYKDSGYLIRRSLDGKLEDVLRE